jgi:hypothetical protein
MWKRSAASVWFHPHFSNMLTITRRSHSSMMSKSEALGESSVRIGVALSPKMESGRRSTPTLTPEDKTTARSITFVQFAHVARPGVVEQGTHGF